MFQQHPWVLRALVAEREEPLRPERKADRQRRAARRARQIRL